MPGPLPAEANLEWLKKHAKALLKQHKARDPESCRLLALLPRFRDSTPEDILAARISLQEVQHALARDHGFTDWGELVRQLEAKNKDQSPVFPAPEQIRAYYLRDDISRALWDLSRRRPLKFYYRTDEDMRRPHARPEFTTLHCLDSPDEFRARVRRLLETAAPSRQPFFPFFGMLPEANSPDDRSRPIGWDLRYEIDLDIRASFRALIPILAVLKHFGVPALAKFSGHRSLHVMIPAEAFPPAMKQAPDHKQWMASFSALGDFLVRFSPALTSTGAGLGKNMALTAPYSLHRFVGNISLPLDLTQSFEFNPKRAAISAFTGVQWRVDHFEAAPDALARMLAFAAEAAANPDRLLDLAQEIFEGRAWHGLVQNGLPGQAEERPVLAALMAGLPGIHFLSSSGHQVPHRLRAALEAIDRPTTKTMRLLNLIGDPGFNNAQTSQFRRPMAECFERWVLNGFEETLAHLMEIAEGDTVEHPVNFAVRMLSILPENPARILDALANAWTGSLGEPEARGLVLLLALAERSSMHPRALRLMRGNRDQPAAPALENLLAQAGPWHIELRPDLTIAALALAFGLDSLDAWAEDPDNPSGKHIIEAAFAGKQKKFAHALRTVHKTLAAREAQYASPRDKERKNR